MTEATMTQTMIAEGILRGISESAISIAELHVVSKSHRQCHWEAGATRVQSHVNSESTMHGLLCFYWSQNAHQRSSDILHRGMEVMSSISEKPAGSPKPAVELAYCLVQCRFHR